MKTLSNKAKSELLKKDGKLKSIYADVIKKFFHGTKVYPVQYTGSGRHISVSDKSEYVRSILKLSGYKFTEGNDAPRGGVSGNYIKISKKALESAKELLKHYS